MKIRITSLFLFLLLAAPSVRAEDPGVPYFRLNLDECVNLAVQNNEQLKAQRYDVEHVLARKIEATKRYVPVLKYQYRFAPVPRDLDNPFDALMSGDVSVLNSIRLELGAPISTFGRISIAKQMADLGVDLAGLQGQQKSDEIALNVYKLYQGVVLARELKALGSQAMDALEQNISALEKEETTDQIQILKLKVILYEVQRRVNEARMKETLAMSTLKLQMGLEDDVNFDIRTSSLRKERFKRRSFESVLAEAESYRPEYKLLEKGLQLRLKEIDLAKREYYPKLAWGGFFDYGYAPGIRGEDQNEFVNPFNYTRAGVGIELSNTLDFRKIKSKIEQAEATYLKTIGQKRAANRGLELDLKKAYMDLKQFEYLLSRAEEEKKAARQIVFLTKSNMDIGLGESKDYYEALQSYMVFQARTFEAIFNYNNAVATLKQKMGKLYAQQQELY